MCGKVMFSHMFVCQSVQLWGGGASHVNLAHDALGHSIVVYKSIMGCHMGPPWKWWWKRTPPWSGSGRRHPPKLWWKRTPPEVVVEEDPPPEVVVEENPPRSGGGRGPPRSGGGRGPPPPPILLEEPQLASGWFALEKRLSFKFSF